MTDAIVCRVLKKKGWEIGVAFYHVPMGKGLDAKRSARIVKREVGGWEVRVFVDGDGRALMTGWFREGWLS